MMTSGKPLFRAFALALACSFAVTCVVSPATASAGSPAIAISTETYHGAGAASACELTLQRARATGVPAEVKARIDGILERVVAKYVPSAPTVSAAWKAQCAETRHEWERYGKTTSMPFEDYVRTFWTSGYARGRWLSVRFHARSYAGGAHPEDAYESVTFDLAHGGYPVPTGGFLPQSRRVALNRLIGDGMIRDGKQNEAGESERDVRASERFDRYEADGLNLDASHFLLTDRGLEVSGYYDAEAGRNALLTIPFAKLDAIGTPGGPLDPATR